VSGSRHARQLPFGERLVTLISGALFVSQVCGPPAVAAAASVATAHITARDLIELNQLSGEVGTGLSVAPDGGHLAFLLHRADIEEDTYRASWMILETGGAHRATASLDAGDAMLFRAGDGDQVNGSWVNEAPQWSSDSRWICYRKLVHATIELWCSDTHGAAKRVTADADSIESFTWVGSGHRLLAKGESRRNSKRPIASPDAHLYDPVVPWSPLHARPNGQSPSGAATFFEVDLDQNLEREATAAESSGYEESSSAFSVIDHARHIAAQFGRNARLVAVAQNGAIAWLSADETGKQGLAPPLSLHTAGANGEGFNKTCAHAECREIVEHIAGGAQLVWSADGSEIYFIRKDGPNHGRTHWYGWNPKSDRIRWILNSTGTSLSDCHVRRDRVFCFREQASSPRTLVSIDFKSGKIDTIFDPNPEFHRFSLGASRQMEWTDLKGHSTFGTLIMPVGYVAGKRYPLVIIGYRASSAFHGGVGGEYPTHLFADNGFLVLVYDQPEDWDALARMNSALDVLKAAWNGERFELSATLSSIEAAIEILDRQGLADPKRVGITGLSTGASHVDFALTHSSRFRAAIVSQPPWSYSTYFLSSSGASWRSLLRDLGLGPAGSGQDATLEAISLDQHPERLTTPLLINASDDEYLPGLQTVIALSEARKPVELHVYPDEYHIKWSPRHLYEIYLRNVDWMKFWLQDEERADASVQPQYARWRSIRAQIAPSDITDH
jgi:dipeptidyl aminopeptidase/acylaminoacyl peptidase